MSERVLEIAEMGREILRTRAEEVALPASAELRALAADMLLTMRAADGVGLAAPQVSAGVRLMISAPHACGRYPQAGENGEDDEAGEIVAFNPEIAEASREMERDWEGCLSIPGLRGLVPRHHRILALWRDADGNARQAELRGFAARVFQHELDHLNGILFLDRMESMRDLATEGEFGRMMAERDASE